MIGIDVSNWQNGLSLALNKDCLDFVIIKATEGIGFTDKNFADFVVQAAELDLLTGCYHFARPDLNGTIQGMEREAECFVEVVTNAGLIGQAILVLDWETEPMDREDLILAWLNKVVQLTGVRPFIYGSKSKLTSTAFKNLINNWPIWMAAWPNTIERSIASAESWVKRYDPKRTTVPWLIWQFSSTGILRGAHMHVDLDYTDITEYDWKNLASNSSYPNPEEIPPTEKLTDDMTWAIEAGLFTGYKDGTYRPKDPLSREQAATLFRRYSSYLEGKLFK